MIDKQDHIGLTHFADKQGRGFKHRKHNLVLASFRLGINTIWHPDKENECQNKYGKNSLTHDEKQSKHCTIALQR